MNAQQIKNRIATLEAEQARIWTVSGFMLHDDDSITVRGVTPATIMRVAKMSSEISHLRTLLL